MSLSIHRLETDMNRFFNLDNPVWRFIGRIADLFVLSALFYICLLPVIFAGSALSALYYVTLKMTRNLEGRIISQFFSSFKENLKQTVLPWTVGLITVFILFIDIRMALLRPSTLSLCLAICFSVIGFVLIVFLSMLFPLIARCNDPIKTQLKNSLGICVQNPLASVSVTIITVSIFLLGIFVFWPILIIAPGLGAYINSYVINNIFRKYSMELR